MPKRYFNWKLVIILVIGSAVLGVTAYGLRQWQRSRRAERGLALGSKAYDEHKYEEAANQLGRYLGVKGDDVPVLLKYADAQLNIRPLKRNNIQQAVAAYRTALRIDKNSSEAVMKLTEMYLGIGMPGEAELIAKRYLETNQNPELRRMLAMAVAEQRKFDEAAAELKTIITENPDQILAYETIGLLAQQRPQNFQQPVEYWFNEAVKNNPSSALAYVIRAAFYIRSNDIIKAAADLEQAEKQDISESVVRLRLAREFINANVLDKAEKHLAAVQSVQPTSQALWQTWATLALKSGSKTMMREIAQAALKEMSFQPWDFMPTAAELYIRCGELELANDCISQLRQKDIVPATTAFLEGMLADRKGNGYEAVKCWYRAIQLGSEPAGTRLALAAALSRLGDKQSAVRQLRTLVSKQPNLLEGHLNLARLLAETGNWAEAAEQANMATQLSPQNLDAALIYIRSRIQLLAETQTDKDLPIWQEVTDNLALLEKASNGALPVKLLQLQLAARQSRFDEARQLLNDIKNNHPAQTDIDMAEVELLIAEEKTDEAIAKLHDIVRMSPDSVVPVRYLVVLLAAKDDRQSCENIIKDALARTKPPASRSQLALLLAELYNRWNEQEKRCQMLNSLAEEMPNDIAVQRELLRCEKPIKDTIRAQQLIDRIKTIEGDDGWQWRYEQAKIWLTQDNFKDRYPQIVSLLKENLLANPDDQNSRMLLAKAYEQAGELQLAVSTYQEALNRSPQDIRIIVPAVAVLYKANAYDRADEILRQAASEKLFHPELDSLELQIRLKRGELNSAGDILEKLLAGDPNNRSVCMALALLKIRQNKFAEADELLNKLKNQEPNDLPTTVAQIELNIRRGKSADAISLCDQIVNNLNNASAYILRGRTYAMLGRTDRAKEDFEHATTIEPNNAEAWAAQSDFYRSTAQLDAAASDIRKAMSIAPDNLAIQKRAIVIFLASAEPDTVHQGKMILENALTANPEDIELLLYKARSLLTEGTAPSIGQATEILQKITLDQPAIGDAWLLLGEIAFRQGQSTRAMDIALRGLVHRPSDKALLMLKARSEAARSPALAIPTLKGLWELDPNNVDIVVQLANIYLAADKSEDAVNLLRSRLASPGSAADEGRIKTALAVALHKNGNKAEAQKELDSLLQSAPDDPRPLLAQVRLLIDDQLWDQLSQQATNWCRNHPGDTHTPTIIAKDLASVENSQAKKTTEDILRMILHNNADNTEAMGVLAMLLQTTGRSAESATLYQQILALRPDNTIAINNLAWIMCEEQGKYQQALELALQGLDKAPNYIDLIDTRGVVYYRMGQFDKAVQDFTRCVNLYPEGTPAAAASYLHLGKTLAKLGQNNKAVESLKQALKLNEELGGLSQTDVAEAQHLMEDLSRGGV